MRRLRPTSILTDAEVSLIIAELERMMPAVLQAGAGLGFDVDARIRFSAVAAKCKEQRESIGQTLKEAAAALRVPQYRIRTIESGSLRELDPDLLLRYVDALAIGPWFSRWKRANTALVRNLGLTRRTKRRHTRLE